LLEIRDLSKQYGEALALDGVSLTLRAGDVVGLVGPNGSGKTTLVKAIVGLVTPSSGWVNYLGQPAVGSPMFRRDVGAVLDGSRNIHWRLTVKQNAKYFATLHHVPPRAVDARVAEIARRLGIGQHLNTQVAKLSTGNKRKVSLLCAMLHQPRVVLMDEPTLGLDAETSAQLMDFIREQAEGKECGFLITSHDFGFVDRICNRVAVIIEGRIVRDSSFAALVQGSYQYVATYRFREAIPAEFEQSVRSGGQGGRSVVKHTDTSLSIGYSDLADGLEILEEAIQYEEQLTLCENRAHSVDHLYREMMRTHQTRRVPSHDGTE